MRIARMSIPEDVFPEFARELVETDLTHAIIEVTPEDEIILDIHYQSEETREVDQLEEFLASLIEAGEE